MSKHRSHEHLAYPPDLGPHHVFYEKRHCTRGYQHTLRDLSAFILDRTIAQPPQHTLLHRSLTEPPMPTREEAFDIIGTAKEYGLDGVLEQIDSPTTHHLRQQMAILAIPRQEAIDRLTRKQYVTQRELIGI